MAVDVIFAIVPIATDGSAAVIGIKGFFSKMINKLDNTSNFGIATYKTLKIKTVGLELKVHHIIEKRFLKHLGNTDEILKVADDIYKEYPKLKKAASEIF